MQADAIIATDESVNPELLEYAEKSGKPFIKIPGNLDENGSALVDFYDSILNPQK